MTELIRRLDPERFAVHVACFREGARGCRGSRSARRRSPSFRSAGFARPATFRAAARLRAVVPARAHRRGPDVRPLREHLRPARSGAGRRAGPDRQPPRAEPGQDRRPDPAAAPGLPLRHDGRRQFVGGRGTMLAAGRRSPAAIDCGDPQRRSTRRARVARSRLPAVATSRAGESSRSPTCGPRRATRR